MLKPDYDRSIINLATSVTAEAAPAAHLYPPLAELSELGLGERPVALMVIDGLGYDYLQRHPHSTLAQYLVGRLSSVFPSTTATAVTGLALGVPAQQHSITGWFTYLRELGCVAAPLPMLPRGGGRPFDESGVHASQLLDSRPLLPRLPRPVSLVTPHYIADSSFSQALYGDVQRCAYRTLDEFFAQTAAALRGPGHPLVWSYWTQLDALAHEYGIESGEVEAHFQTLDQGVSRFLEQMRGSGALLLVSADHGLIDTAAERVIHLEDHPELQVLLQLPLCGEPRAAFCYLRDGAGPEFAAYVKEALGDRLSCKSSLQLLEEGWFGRGDPGLRLRERIGDYVLLPRDNWVVKDRLLQESAFDQIGVHGGLSSQELYVPLVIAEP